MCKSVHLGSQVRSAKILTFFKVPTGFEKRDCFRPVRHFPGLVYYPSRIDMEMVTNVTCLVSLTNISFASSGADDNNLGM